MGLFKDKSIFDGGVGVKSGDALGTTAATITLLLNSGLQSQSSQTMNIHAQSTVPDLVSANAILVRELIRKGVIDGSFSQGY